LTIYNIEIMNVFITHRSFSFAVGKSGQEKVFIKNGDLITSDTVEVVHTGSDRGYLITEIKETVDNEEVLIKKRDFDELVDTRYIKFTKQSFFTIDNKWVFADNRINRIVDYIINIPELWEKSKLSLRSSRKVLSRARVFGITFKQAVDKVQLKGYEKARLYCEKQKDFSELGVIAEMLAITSNDSEGQISFEVWQGVINVQEVFYAHAILNKDKTKFCHFDCAVIDFDISDKELLFNENRKIKGNNYEKLFRIDGQIDFCHVFNIADKFFPLDSLIEEYFGIENIN
jgi:hypothetical protein